MIDYKAIADEAEQYSDYQAAFDVMSLEEKDEHKELSSNNLREWAANYQSDYLAIKSDGGVLSEMAMKQIDIDSSPLDMRKESVRGLVNALLISDDGIAALLSLSTIKVKVWQGVARRHIKKAMELRARGEI